MSKTFYASRLSARHSGKPVKDAGKDAKKGQRWYTLTVITEGSNNAELAALFKDAAPVADPVLQEIFNGAAKHLLKQGVKSAVNNTCRYRGSNGVMCAAGPFIADVHYTPSLENNVVGNSIVTQALKNSGFPVENRAAMGLLSDMQNCHDRHPVEQWGRELNKVATRYNLSASVVNNPCTLVQTLYN